MTPSYLEGTNEDMDSLFGIAMPMLHDLNSQKCNNHLVSFIKVAGLFVSYIVAIFDTIKSKMTVWRYI